MLNNMNKKTLVMGASDNPDRYSYLATNKLKKHGFEVIAFGKKEGSIFDTKIETILPIAKDIDTITLYLNPMNQREYYDFIISTKPNRVIFNPGTENPELETLLTKNSIPFEEACTLVLLSTGNY